MIHKGHVGESRGSCQPVRQAREAGEHLPATFSQVNQGLAVVADEEGQTVGRGTQKAKGLLREAANVEAELAGPQLDRRVRLVGDRLVLRDDDRRMLVQGARAASRDPLKNMRKQDAMGKIHGTQAVLI